MSQNGQNSADKTLIPLLLKIKPSVCVVFEQVCTRDNVMDLILNLNTMLEFLIGLFNNASSLVDWTRRQEDVQRKQEHAIGPVVSKEAPIVTNKLQSELEALSREFGELKAGKRIVVQLRDMLRILPRERRRADAYKGLKAELNRNGIDLIIISNRSHKNQNYDK